MNKPQSQLWGHELQVIESLDGHQAATQTSGSHYIAMPREDVNSLRFGVVVSSA
jgi:hypothetical protein